MPYVQISTKCNFHCSHCGMNSTHKGQDMSLKTFRNAIQLDNDNITLGGGEPTLHKLFWTFLGESLATGCESVWLATNGSQTNISLALAKMAQKGVIGCALSQDPFHPPIDKRVVEAFKREPINRGIGYPADNDFREIRNTSNNLIKAGRCKTGKIGCICEELFIKPDGTVKACGCVKSPSFGNVNTHVEIPKDWECGLCYKKQGNK